MLKTLEMNCTTSSGCLKEDEIIRIVVSDNNRERLDRYVAQRSTFSRSKIIELIKSGELLVNREAKKACYKVRIGDIIEFSPPKTYEINMLPEPIDIEILYEDEHIVLVNKPIGMVVYPAAGHRSGTLVNALLYHCGKLSKAAGEGREGIVHRLDKDTSGAIVLAKSDRAYYRLREQFSKRMVIKHYIAIVYGLIREEKGEIITQIGRSRSDRKKMTTRTNRGREAITHYKVIKRSKIATLLDISIITGRTHQIRVHFSSLGHPVLGDTIYGRKKKIAINKEIYEIKRQMLHCSSLGFQHPETGEFMTFKAPIPDDMKILINKLNLI